MAAPTVNTANESSLTTAGTSHTVSLPATVNAGDLLIVLFGHAVSATIDALAGWNELVDDGATNGVGVLWKRAVGNEDGTTITLVTSAATKSTHISYSITGANNTTAPAISTVATGTTNAPDPTTCNPGTSKDRLWITFFVGAGEEADDDTWCNNAATGYGSLLQKASGTGGLPATNCAIASCVRTATAASEDAAWPAASTDQVLGWRAHTIGIQAGGGIFSAGSYYKA